MNLYTILQSTYYFALKGRNNFCLKFFSRKKKIQSEKYLKYLYQTYVMIQVKYTGKTSPLLTFAILIQPIFAGLSY